MDRRGRTGNNHTQTNSVATWQQPGISSTRPQKWSETWRCMRVFRFLLAGSLPAQHDDLVHLRPVRGRAAAGPVYRHVSLTRRGAEAEVQGQVVLGAAARAGFHL